MKIIDWSATSALGFFVIAVLGTAILGSIEMETWNKGNLMIKNSSFVVQRIDQDTGPLLVDTKFNLESVETLRTLQKSIVASGGAWPPYYEGYLQVKEGFVLKKKDADFELQDPGFKPPYDYSLVLAKK